MLWLLNLSNIVAFSALMLMGSRNGIWPVKNWLVGCWCGYLSGSRCRLAFGPADAIALTVSCFSKIQIGFTFLVPAHPCGPGQRAVKRVCVWLQRYFFVVTDDDRRWQFESITLHRNVLLQVLFGVAECYWLNLAVVSVGLWKLDTC